MSAKAARRIPARAALPAFPRGLFLWSVLAHRFEFLLHEGDRARRGNETRRLAL